MKDIVSCAYLIFNLYRVVAKASQIPIRGAAAVRTASKYRMTFSLVVI